MQPVLAGTTRTMATERFKRFKERTGYTQEKLADMFGVDPVSIRNWLGGRSEMHPRSLQTLLRLEADFLSGPQSPLSPAGRKAFTEGRHAKSA